jgi:hypothetical protein
MCERRSFDNYPKYQMLLRPTQRQGIKAHLNNQQRILAGHLKVRAPVNLIQLSLLLVSSNTAFTISDDTYCVSEGIIE